MCKRCEKEISKIPGLTPSLFEAIRSIGKCPAMKALEHLTPGGSEYYEDPTRCIQTIRFLLEQRMDLLLEKQKEINRLNLLLRGNNY